jgi:hypothetical protein
MNKNDKMEVIQAQLNTISLYDDYIPEELMNEIKQLASKEYSEENYVKILEKIAEAYIEIERSEEYESESEDSDEGNTKEVKRVFRETADSLPEFFYGSYALHIDVEYREHKLETLVDTGAMVNILYEDVAEKMGVLDGLFREKTSIRGIGNSSSECIGFIPKLLVKFGEREFVLANVKVLKREKKNGTDMIIGLSTMFYYGAILDLKNRKIKFNDEEIPIKVYDASVIPSE